MGEWARWRGEAKTKTKNIPTIEDRQSNIKSTMKSQGNSSGLEKPGSQLAHNKTDAQGKHTKHCYQYIYMGVTNKCRKYL